jgi:hypothetical protein
VLAASVREQLTNHSAHRGLPPIGIVFCLGELGDVQRGIPQGSRIRLAEFPIPAVCTENLIGVDDVMESPKLVE